jgi:hypothetical protein
MMYDLMSSRVVKLFKLGCVVLILIHKENRYIINKN